MIDENQNQAVQINNEITKKVEEIKKLKKDLKELYKPLYHARDYTMLPIDKPTHKRAKETLDKYKDLTGIRHITWDDFINVLLKLCNDYINNLTNAKENENPINK